MDAARTEEVTVGGLDGWTWMRERKTQRVLDICTVLIPIVESTPPPWPWLFKNV